MGFLDTSAILQPGYVKTTSRLQMWWLTAVKGYAVERVMRYPLRYRMGQLKYGNAWVLKPPAHRTEN